MGATLFLVAVFDNCLWTRLAWAGAHAPASYSVPRQPGGSGRCDYGTQNKVSHLEIAYDVVAYEIDTAGKIRIMPVVNELFPRVYENAAAQL